MTKLSRIGDDKLTKIREEASRAMERIPVQSSNIAAIGYDDTNAILEVEFLNGSIYQYYGVPRDTYDSLMNAASKGSFLNAFIKKAGYGVTRMQ